MQAHEGDEEEEEAVEVGARRKDKQPRDLETAAGSGTKAKMASSPRHR